MVWNLEEEKIRKGNMIIMEEKLKVVILCVNYNSYDSLSTYLDSIRHAYAKINELLELTIIVADNSTKKEVFNEDYPFILKNIDTGDNLGYFGGIKAGIQKSGVILSYFDYIIISNVDIQLTDDFFEELCKYCIIGEIGCIAPQIYSKSERRDRNPKIIIRPSRRKLQIQKVLYRFPVLDYIYIHLFYSRRRQKLQNYPAGNIYAAHGSFIIFTNKFADFLQHIDYPCFLFGEEIYLAENLKRKFLKINYEPSIKVYDSDHVNTRKMKSKAYYRYNYEAIDMLLREYFNE